MFTGLVEDLGTIVSVDRDGDGAVLTVESRLAPQIGEGDSVAVNGVCLTATGIRGERFGFDVMLESLRRSSLGELDAGSAVNLELALRADARLGGHIMQGHVDGVGAVSGIREDGFSRVVTIETDPDLLKYVVEKGSIAVDGVSLTVSRVDDSTFDVSLIPETLERTNLGGTSVGRTVNLEVDVVAKYVEKLVGAHAR
ncbi:MAG TPA: riboflavin synthase [Baekduia sp.]|uniref:riboflavin synthase n=1 Tax=Baekduia sp. TaxID=2600305 RepID=UPI002D7799EC|nr:riboflavin synthase [Baekduia sp.]HET6508570.1 riboflavin synthase [Baekduia sp.]